MLKLKLLIFIALLILTISIASAATIHGTIYDLSLKKTSNARVEINTSPKQFLIAQNGSYSFNVPNGDYTIKAQLMQKSTVLASVQEKITIKQPGDYVLDLILFPDIEEGVEEIDIDVNGEVIEPADKNNMLIIATIFLMLIAVFVGLYYIKKNKKQKKEQAKAEENEVKKEEKREDADLSQITEIIKKEGGRTTQKEIRKQIPLSEAKISLMIAELEHKGIIDKIKKGRGNIIILKRK